MVYEFIDHKGQIVAFDGRVFEEFHHQNSDTDRKHIRHIKSIELKTHRKGRQIIVQMKKFGAFVYIAADDQLPYMEAFVEAVNETLREAGV